MPWRFFAFLLLLSACAIGPNYHKPVIPAPQAWLVQEAEVKDVVDTPWWQQFQDPVLNDLIQAALRENLDLKIATARVEQFYGQYGATRSYLFPNAGYDASASRERSSERGNIPIPESVSPDFNTYKAEFTASWELDIWGRLRRATEAAKADLLSTEEARRGVILTLITSVANAYINLRSLDKQLEITQLTAKSYAEVLKIIELTYKVGNISELELSQAQSQYYSAIATVPAIERQIAQQENALSVLLGRNPGSIPRGKTIDQLAFPVIPAGLPSDLLVRRPDIRQAEQQLIAANARIGVAKGQYFPSISLTGFFGSSSTELKDLFSGPAHIWNFKSVLTGPIFTGGRIKGQVRAAEAGEQEMLFTYQRAIQAGFQEVNDALVDQNRTRVQREAQNNQLDSSPEVFRTCNNKIQERVLQFSGSARRRNAAVQCRTFLYANIRKPVQVHGRSLQSHGRRMGLGRGSNDAAHTIRKQQLVLPNTHTQNTFLFLFIATLYCYILSQDHMNIFLIAPSGIDEKRG